MDEFEILTTCPLCGETDSIVLTRDEYINYLRWQNKELLIQEALPNRSAHEREQLKTGICPHCWDELFGGPAS